jgi:integrase
MGTVYKKTFTKPLPAGAKVIFRKGKRLAEWKDAKGKTRTAPLTDAGDRVAVTAGTYTAKYRDGAGIVREVATGCRDESAARSILAKLERRAELVKAEVITAAEDAIIDHQSTPLADHIAAFIDHQRAKGVHRVRVKNTENRLRRLATDCDYRRLGDLSVAALERWLADRQAENMGAGTRNAYRQELVGFGNWCVKTRRLIDNPFAHVPKADTKADQRRQRRALTEAELTRLLDVARRRPLLDAMTIRRGKRRGEAVGRLRAETRRRLELLGRERALIYKTLALTGLRKGELASITVGQCVLDSNPPYLILNAADEKNREGSTIPLRADLAADLREWLSDKATAAQQARRCVPSVQFDPKDQLDQKRNASDSTRREGQSCQHLSVVPTLPADTPLFIVPKGLVRILDRDLRLAGIPKVDERGRTVDVHALRHTFGTLLSAAGVAPRTAQAAMRHSTIDLTMNVYTDPKLLDVAGAMEALPALPLNTSPLQQARATGTNDQPVSPLAPTLAPTFGKTCMLGSILDKVACESTRGRRSAGGSASACVVKRKDPLTTLVNGSSIVERRRVELPTSALRTQRSPN